MGNELDAVKKILVNTSNTCDIERMKWCQTEYNYLSFVSNELFN